MLGFQHLCPQAKCSPVKQSRRTMRCLPSSPLSNTSKAGVREGQATKDKEPFEKKVNQLSLFKQDRGLGGAEEFSRRTGEHLPTSLGLWLHDWTMFLCLPKCCTWESSMTFSDNLAIYHHFWVRFEIAINRSQKESHLQIKIRGRDKLERKGVHGELGSLQLDTHISRGEEISVPMKAIRQRRQQPAIEASAPEGLKTCSWSS